MTLQELIGNVTAEEVDSQAFAYIPKNWTAYARLPGLLTAALVECRGRRLPVKRLLEVFALPHLGLSTPPGAPHSADAKRRPGICMTG